MILTPAHSTVLYNLENGLDYSIGLHQQQADECLVWLTKYNYIKNGRISSLGSAVLILCPPPEGTNPIWNTRWVKTGKFVVLRKGKLVVVDKPKLLEKFAEQWKGEIQVGNEWVDVSQAERED